MNKVKGLHPLAESVAKKLFGIESVPVQEQKAMVYRAVMHIEEYIKSKDHAEEMKDRYEIDEEKVFHNIDCWFGTEVNEDYIKYLIKKLAKSNDIVRVKE